MSVLIILISISLLVAIGFLASFVWAVRSGQYKDTDAPAVRILYEDRNKAKSDKGQPSPTPPRESTRK